MKEIGKSGSVKEKEKAIEDLRSLLVKIIHCLNLEDHAIERVTGLDDLELKECALFYFYELRSRVVYTQNIFEIIGTLYNTNQLNKEIIKGFFKTMSQQFYDELKAAIEKRRNQQPTLFKEWQNMNEELQK